jgi:hypothetical protein
MAKPIPLTSGHFDYPLQPARDLTLADHIGRTLALATGERLETAKRIFNTMTPEAKGRAMFAGSVAALGGE